jgi:hypothetical protein
VSFLGLTFLLALPLAAVPVLLHLFDRRRRVVIEWGAMQFLVQAARRRTSARRLQEWLLLLLRTLAILCLVLALARPLVHSRWSGPGERREHLLVIDNSLSMMRTADGKSLYEAATQSAGELLDGLPPGDTVRVLLASPYPVWMSSESQRLSPEVRSALKEQLQKQQTTLGRSDLLGSLFTAVQADVLPATKRRRVVVFTDGQKSDWNINDTSGWQRLQDVLHSAQVPTELDVKIVGTSSQAGHYNLAVNRIELNRTIVGVNQPITVTAQVQNHGPTKSDPCSMKWAVGKEDVHQSQIPNLDPGDVFDVVWNYSFSSLGVFAVSGEIDAHDVLVPDNRGTVIVEVVNRVPVLVVEGFPHAAEILQDAYLVQSALGWMDGEPLGTQGVHMPTVVTPDQLERTDLTPFRAVLIPNLADVSEELVRKLQGYVFDGGGLWLALGPRTDVERFNQYFFADATGLAPLAVDHVVDESGDGTSKTLIDPAITTHPATTTLADSTRLDTGRIVVSRRFRFVPPPAGESASVLLSLSNGEPLAIEKLVGRGRVIVQSIPLRLQWSELARSEAFVVMVQEWLSYLTRPQATRHNLQPGEPISLQLTGSDAQDATLRTPQGQDVELTADPTSGGVVFRTGRTIQPGDYSLEVGLSGDQIPFHVQRDPLESSLVALQTADLELLADVSKVSRSSPIDSRAASLPSDPIWPLLLTLLVGLILAELMLSAQMSRLRFGNDPIAETTGGLADEATGISGTGIPGFTTRRLGRATDARTAVPRSRNRATSGTGAEIG